jgi:hypothetical protein
MQTLQSGVGRDVVAVDLSVNRAFAKLAGALVVDTAETARLGWISTGASFSAVAVEFGGSQTETRGHMNYIGGVVGSETAPTSPQGGMF